MCAYFVNAVTHSVVPAASGAKTLPPVGNFPTEYARPPSSLPSATVTSTTPQVLPTGQGQVYHNVPGNPRPGVYGPVTYDPTSVQPPSTPMNNYFTPVAPTQNVSGYQVVPPMMRPPVVQAPPLLPNTNLPGSVNPYARSTGPKF